MTIDNKPSRRRALLTFAALAGGAALACARSNVPFGTAIPQTKTDTPDPNLNLDPTPSPISTNVVTRVPTTSISDTTFTPAAISKPIETATLELPKPPEFTYPYIETIFLGMPFDVVWPEESAQLGGRWNGPETFSITKPLIVTGSRLTEDQKTSIDPHNVANNPRIALVFPTSNIRKGTGLIHKMVYAHSGWYNGVTPPEELPFDFFKRIVNISGPDKLIGAKLSIVQNGNVANLEVIDCREFKEAVFNGAMVNYEDQLDPAWKAVPLFLDFSRLKKDETDTVGIDTSVYPYNQGTDLVTFVACNGPDGNISENRMVITAKVVK